MYNVLLFIEFEFLPIRDVHLLGNSEFVSDIVEWLFLHVVAVQFKVNYFFFVCRSTLYLYISEVVVQVW